MPRSPTRCVSGLLAAAILVAVLAGCGSSQPKSAATAADFKRALAGAPPALAALYGAPGRVLDGGPPAFKRQIANLMGHPVVVNKWASWCGPCRFEFPFFQKQVTKRGKSIAFLGVDGEDSRDGARSFVAKYPVPYPSFFDPHSDIARVFHGDRSFPTTAFYDRTGKLSFIHQGEYTTEAKLVADIHHYSGA